MKIKNHHNKNPNILAFDVFGLKFCLALYTSALYTMLKLPKTTSPNKLFDYDCVTLYFEHDLFIPVCHVLVIPNDITTWDISIKYPAHAKPVIKSRYNFIIQSTYINNI